MVVLAARHRLDRLERESRRRREAGGAEKHETTDSFSSNFLYIDLARALNALCGSRLLWPHDNACSVIRERELKWFFRGQFLEG